MCSEPEFDLPESFLDRMRKVDAGEAVADLALTLAPDTEALVQKIAMQTGFSQSAVASALLNEGVAAFRLRGILF